MSFMLTINSYDFADGVNTACTETPQSTAFCQMSNTVTQAGINVFYSILVALMAWSIIKFVKLIDRI